MYITVIRKNSIIKSFEMALSLCVPAFIIQGLFRNYGLSVLVFVYNLEIGIALYALSRKQLMRKFWVNALILLGYSMLGCYLSKFYVISMIFVLISSFFAFYILKYKTTIQSQIMKYAIVDYLIFSFNLKMVQGYEWVVVLVGIFGLLVYFLINYFFYPESDFLYIKKIHKRFVKAYDYYTRKLIELTKLKKSNIFFYKRHKKRFHEDYFQFIGAITELPKNSDFTQEETELLYQDVALHHSIIKKFNLLEESILHLIELEMSTKEIIELIQRFLKSFKICLKNSDDISKRKMESIFQLIYLRLQKIQTRNQVTQTELTELLFSIRGLSGDIEKIYSHFLEGSC
ncbi:MAG: hypothetical protein NTX05_07255 [Fusobacteria bacterium]|nr:hypothetical protein [Fusobacteriota bacterium]